MAGKLRVNLSGAPLTMLATLYAKALDVDLPEPILGDRWAKDIVDRLDYDWSKTTITPRTSPSVSTRSAHFDTWTRQFLAVHPRSTVLHLGCGLDSRYFRIDPAPDVEWYDVDYPDVAALRTQLFRARAVPRRRLVGHRPRLPRCRAPDRPTLMIGEGLTIYLTPDDGIALMRRAVDRFPSGELQFDAFNTLGIKTQWSNRVVTRAGATLKWGINGPGEILEGVPGTRLLAWMSVFDSESFRAISGPYRMLGKAMSALPSLRYMAQYHRYAFGSPSSATG